MIVVVIPRVYEWIQTHGTYYHFEHDAYKKVYLITDLHRIDQ